MAKYKMSDDFDKEKAALRQEFNDLKTRIDQVTSRTLLITMLANAGSLFSRASELGIDFNISELLASAESKVKFYENEIAQDRDSQNREEQERLAETLAKAQRVANEAREAELRKHVKEYDAISEDFHKQLTKNRNLRKQGLEKPSSLTAEQKRILAGEYANYQERKAAKEEDKQESDAYKLVYQIRKEAKASIKYREDKIAENLVKLENSPDKHTKKTLEKENDEHTQAIKEHKVVALKKTEHAIKERDSEREDFKKLVEQDPNLWKRRVRKHFKNHVEDYKEELQENPEHKGLHELHEIVKKVGLDKELIIDTHTSQEQTPATTTKDINTPANLAVHDQETQQEKQLSQEASNPITETKNINTPANLAVHDQETKQEKQLSKEALLQTKGIREALEKTRDEKPVQKDQTLPTEKKNITSQRLQRLANKGKGIT
ncbi:hypothetical protein [Candidatus Tisiphia endosymbiont of Parasteatoda lunata]|uniref:hypothetical protein n=1 Tax=Candidatus Tisiphia endosymbiont of Parasteatoda lunata TaxID=3066275 RepID=UPI00313E4495